MIRVCTLTTLVLATLAFCVMNIFLAQGLTAVIIVIVLEGVIVYYPIRLLFRSFHKSRRPDRQTSKVAEVTSDDLSKSQELLPDSIESGFFL